MRWIVVVAAAAGVIVALMTPSKRAPRRAVTTPASATALAAGSALPGGDPLAPIPLIDENGHATSLSAFKGRWVVFAPSMTLCHEVCPMTTGLLMELTRMLHSAGLSSRVLVAEVTVDPWRDTPARLRAYKRMTGADFTMLTGSVPNVLALWKKLGILVQRIPLEKPVPIDWYTHKPETLNIAHSDGLFILDPSGAEHVVVSGMPKLAAGQALGSALRRLLDSEGVHNLHHPEAAYTASQLIDDLRSSGAVPRAGGGSGQSAGT